jgi:hypothetical protein
MEKQSLVSSTPEKTNYDSSSPSSSSSITIHIKRQTDNPYKTEIDANKSIASTTDSLSYSSSESSDENSSNSKITQITLLRPSSTIYPNTNSQNQKRNAPKLNQEWKNFFKAAPRISSSSSIQQANQDKTTLRQTKIQNRDSFQKDNLPFGDSVYDDNKIEGFLFHNINGIKDESNWTQINLTMSELNISCFGFVEINSTFRGTAFSRWNEITRKTFKYSRQSASESDITFKNHHKPGGTLTTVVGRWQSRVTKKGHNPTGLGRWSYLKFSSNKQNLIVITAYRPCKTMGPTTTWTQQWLLLREKNKNPDPIKAFDKDLADTLIAWKQKGHEILLMIDANEDIGRKPGGMGQIIYKAGLLDLISNKHDAENTPNTYARGSKRLDYLFGTEKVLEHCSTCGILPFGYGYPSDHRAIFARINLSKILQSKMNPAESNAQRLLISATPNERKMFLNELHQHYESQNLYSRLQSLWQTSKDEWTDDHQTEYDHCDEQHIKGMLSAERKTCKKKLYDWSPAFSKAVEVKAFWKIVLSLRRNHIRPNAKLYSWATSLNVGDVHELSESTIKAELRLAQKQLRSIKDKAKEHREQHLRDLIAQASVLGDDKTHEKRLQILLRAHTRQRSFKRIQQVLRPTVRGGISYVVVPAKSNPEDYPYDPGKVKNWEMIHDQQRLEQFLIKRNTVHFGQAHGTPFTIAPLNKLDWNASSSEAESLLNGQIPTVLQNKNPFAMDILRHIAHREQLPEIDTYLSPDEIAQGFHRWKETTSTSPSGCHLGLRRIPAIPTADEETKKIRTNILGIQSHIINIPTAQGFSPK